MSQNPNDRSLVSNHVQDANSEDPQVNDNSSNDLEKNVSPALNELGEQQVSSDEEKYNEKFHSAGVERIEKVKLSMDNTKKGKFIRIWLCIILFVCAWVLSLDSVTTYNYQPYATSSFGHHAMLSSVSIATSLMSSVSKPIIAKISDVASRPTSYFIVLVLYTMGYIITAASSSISAYVVGSVFISVGSSGIELLNSIIAADITPLKYRGFIYGVLSTPYLINTWYAGVVAEHFIATNWRWGYGMFAILVPVTIIPSIGMMIYLEHYAVEEGLVEPPRKKRTTKQWSQLVWKFVLEVDLFGLILMAFGWSLLLLPFSLYSSAKGQWTNPSLIAMFVVGGILLIVYTVYEFWYAPFPSMPKRVLFNRTFMTAVVIDFFYMCGGMMRLLYFSSYVGVIKDWSTANWTYFNNTLSLGLCFFGLIVGIIQRITHRCKFIQVFGLSLQVVSMGITLWARYDNAHTVALVWTQLLIGIGGACSVVGSQVASQASVPHQDTALVIALLSQWSSIGYAIGCAIAGAIWQSKLPGYLREFIPSSVDDATVTTLYSSYAYIQEYPMGTEIREGAMKAYFETCYYLFCASLGLTCIPFVVSFFQRNYYLGDTQNAIEADDQIVEPKNKFEKFIKWMDNPVKYYADKKASNSQE